MTRKAPLAVLLCLAALGLARDAAAFGKGDKGRAGAQFLKIAPGARPSGMGEAFAGVADDIHSVYYNPAGLGTLRRVEVTGSHSAQFQGVRYNFAALAVPLLSWVDTDKPRNAYGVLGVAIYSLSVDEIERRGTTETDDPLDEFEAADFAYALTYAYKIPDTGLSLGVTAKAIKSEIGEARANTAAADFGALWRHNRLGVGAGVRNVGGDHGFNEAADPLPLTIFSGAAYKFSDRLIGSTELDLPRDSKATVGVGVEYKHPFADKLTGSVRSGYNTKNTDADELAGVSFGMGVGYSNFNFDFAFIPFGDLGNVFRYSLVVKF